MLKYIFFRIFSIYFIPIDGIIALSLEAASCQLQLKKLRLDGEFLIDALGHFAKTAKSLVPLSSAKPG